MPRILIIDDEPDLRLALTATLEDHGYEVVEGSDGSEALDLAVQYAPDPIFLDVNMPVIDGTAALEILRRGGPRTSDIPICMLTPVSDAAYREYVLGLGADAFFVKPWSEDHMMRRLAELSDSRADLSSGAMSTDSCVQSAPVPSPAATLKMERSERTVETIQARHNTWVSWG
jgi:CheY-like chemotaxis protein